MPIAGTLTKEAKKRNLTTVELVKETLAANGGNEFKTALALGVYPGTIRYWRVNYIEKPPKN